MSAPAMIRTAFGRLARLLRRPKVSRAFRQALRQIGPGDIAIDAGANVGLYTLMMAATGATVHAFEPDPVAFRQLTRRVGRRRNVVLHQAAVSDRDRIARLYLHKDRATDPVRLSQSSSLMAGKSNVSASDTVEVETVNFGHFVLMTGPIALLKMDIEGHEIEALGALLKMGLGDLIHRAFVELHDRKNPALIAPTAQLRANLALFGDVFDLTWH